MDLLIPYLVPAALGGVLLAAFLLYSTHTARRPSAIHRVDWHGPAEIINATHLHVAGVGGLGLVAMAVVVAWNLPAIRAALTIAFALGVLLAVAMIVWRERTH